MDKKPDNFEGRVRRAVDEAPRISATVNQDRTLRIGRHDIVIGIPYRDDRFGDAILTDVEVVARGTRCTVKVIPPGEIRLDHVDALFLPGGPFDQPGTVQVQGARPRLPKEEGSAQDKERLDRHRRELAIIKEAERRNIPILGVCGGSRRLATAKGATQVLLTPSQARQHTGNMDLAATEIKHTVQIQPCTLLHEIVATGTYRLIPLTEVHARIEALTIEVNSVHWASSHFPRDTTIRVTAVDDDVVEGFEDPAYHFHVGVQWHPEHAQLGKGDFAGKAEPHARVMGALGEAAIRSRAANVIKGAIRNYNARRRMESPSTSIRSPTTAVLPPSALAVAAAAVPTPTTIRQISPPRTPTSPLLPPPHTTLSLTAPSLVTATVPIPLVTTTVPIRSASPPRMRTAPLPSTTRPAAAPRVKRLSGTISSFDTSKGFGFIEGDNGYSYFVHITSITSGRAARGVRVTFEAVPRQQKNWAAVRVICG